MGRRSKEGKAPVNVLSTDKQLAVLAALVEGNSERAVERLSGVNRETVGRLALTLGEGAQRLHDRLVRDLTCTQIVADEVWSFCQVKQARVQPHHAEGSGEAYTFVALDKTSRMAISFYVGKRDQASTDIFMADLRSRLLVMPSITTDGFAPYVSAVGAEFGKSVDFAQTVKNYRSKGRRDDHRYEPPRGIDFITKKAVYGAPDLDNASTAYIERNNGTMRHKIGRMRRLVYAFSKKLPNHRAACALNYVWYNLGCIVRTLRVTPAMAAGVSDHVWSLPEFLEALLTELPASKPAKQPLTHRAPAVTARELPKGRGFLRVVQGGNVPPVAPMPPTTPAPVRQQASPVAPPVKLAPRRHEQLSLFEPNAGKGSSDNQPEF